MAKQGYSEKLSTLSDVKTLAEVSYPSLEVVNNDEGAVGDRVLDHVQSSSCDYCSCFTSCPRNTDPTTTPLALLPAVEPAVTIMIDVRTVVTRKQLASTLARRPPVPVRVALEGTAHYSRGMSSIAVDCPLGP